MAERLAVVENDEEELQARLNQVRAERSPRLGRGQAPRLDAQEAQAPLTPPSRPHNGPRALAPSRRQGATARAVAVIALVIGAAGR